MGHVVPPEKPDDTCPACVGWLPSTLYGEIEVPNLGTFRGYIRRSEWDPMMWGGMLEIKGGGKTPLIVAFCNDNDAIFFTSLGPIAAECGAAAAEVARCNLPAEAESPGKCIFRVRQWP